MSIIALWKVRIFSLGKELHESILISPKFIVLLFSLVRCLILSQTSSNNPWSNNTKCLNSPPQTLINPSILSYVICNGFSPVEVLYEMSKTEIFSYNFSSNKISLKRIYSFLIISSKYQYLIFPFLCFIFYTDINITKLVDNICYFYEKQL